MISSAISDLRNECAAFRAKLSVPQTEEDEILRQDIARIAAKMLALTTATEGETSPIPDLLAKNAENGPGHSKLIAALKDIAPALVDPTGSSGPGA